MILLASTPVACGVSRPAAEVGSDQTSPPAPAEAATPTAAPTPEPEVETPIPSPTLVPTDTSPAQADNPATTVLTPIQAEVTMQAGNPDLDYAQVIFVRATQNSEGRWSFDTTVRHNDQGWDDYADAWQVVDPHTGQVLAERILLHPHENEQPFTRSQRNIEIPPDITQVIVRAKDNVEGFGGREVLVDLTVAQGKHFEVTRPKSWRTSENNAN